MKKRVAILTVILGCLIFQSYSQKVTDIRTYGQLTGGDEASGVVADKHGNHYITGIFYGTLDFGNGFILQANRGFQDIFLIKRNRDGEIIWAKSYGSDDEDRHHAWYTDSVDDITIDDDGNVYLLGQVNCSADLIFGSIVIPESQTLVGKNVFVAKFNSNGDCLWITINETNPNAAPKKIVVSPDKQVTITGAAYGGERFGDFTLPSGLNGDGSYLASLNEYGEVVWAKGFHVSIYDLYYDNNDNLYCIGTTNRSEEFDNILFDRIGLTDFFMAKLSSSGNVLWLKTDGELFSSMRGYAIDGIEDKVFVLISTENSFSLRTYDTDGNNLWKKEIGTSSWWSGSINTDIKVNASSDVYTLFHSSGSFNIGNLSFYASGVEAFIIKFSENGEALWGVSTTTTLINNSYTKLRGIWVDEQNYLYTSGYLMGGVSINSSVVVTSNNRDGNHNTLTAIIKDLSTTSMEEKKNVSNPFIYPNPSDGNITILYDKKSLVNGYVKVYDVLGHTVLFIPVDSNTTNIDMTSLKKGMYILKLGDKERIIHLEKLILKYVLKIIITPKFSVVC